MSRVLFMLLCICCLLLTGCPPRNTERSAVDRDLLQAAKAGSMAGAKKALHKGANINVMDDDGSTPLHLAVQHEQGEMVSYLLSQQAVVNAMDHSGATALHYAAKQGNVETIKLLLEKKADASATDSFKRSPLHYAALHGHRESVQLLVSANAEMLSAKSTTGQTPADLAREQGHAEVGKMLDQLKGK
jgi:ankyrin repeat protein